MNSQRDNTPLERNSFMEHCFSLSGNILCEYNASDWGCSTPPVPTPSSVSHYTLGSWTQESAIFELWSPAPDSGSLSCCPELSVFCSGCTLLWSPLLYPVLANPSHRQKISLNSILLISHKGGDHMEWLK